LGPQERGAARLARAKHGMGEKQAAAKERCGPVKSLEGHDCTSSFYPAPPMVVGGWLPVRKGNGEPRQCQIHDWRQKRAADLGSGR